MKTHCKYRHPRTPDNVTKEGQCRTCKNKRDRNRKCPHGRQRYYCKNCVEGGISEKTREKMRARSRNRRARKQGNGGTFTATEWVTLKRQYGFRCVGCWKPETELKALGRKLVPDHILSLKNGGLNHVTNLQPLCHGPKGCNNSKGAKYVDFMIS